MEDLDQALRLKPDDILALVDRGVFRFLGGDLIGALADLDQAIKHDPGQPSDVLKLRDAIAKVSALQPAPQFLVTAILLSPTARWKSQTTTKLKVRIVFRFWLTGRSWRSCERRTQSSRQNWKLYAPRLLLI